MEEKYFEKQYKNFNRDCEIAENILEYSLFLPKIKPINSQSEEDWVQQAVFQSYLNCHRNLFKQTRYHFFGSEEYTAEINSVKIFNDLPILMPNSNIFEKINEDFFAKTLLSHCIMAAYDTTMSLIPIAFSESYKLNKIKNEGIQSLLNEGFINKSTFEISRLKHNEKTEDEITNTKGSSGKASDLDKLRDSHKPIYDFVGYKSFFGINQGLMTIRETDILFSLLQIDARQLKSFLDLYSTQKVNDIKTSTVRKNWQKFCERYKELYKIPPKRYVDYLYYYYKLENVFGLDLAHYIFQSIDKLKNRAPSYPDGIHDFRVLAEISCFPNVFSRNLFFKYALSYVYNDVSVRKSCFLRPDSVETMVGSALPSEFAYNDWVSAFARFCKFFNKLIFPAEEWYFFLTIKKTIDKYNTLDSTEKMLKLNNLLAQYINDNVQYRGHLLGSIYQIRQIPEEDGFDSRKPNIAMLLSFFNDAKLHKTFPLSSLNKENLLPKQDEGVTSGKPTAHDIYYKALMQHYISVITDN